jgi:hypothetical protein
MINRLGVLALPRQRDPQVVPGVGEIGAQLDRSLKRGNGFIKFILARQGDTEALENPRLVGPDADCLVIGGHCFVEPTLVGKRVAQADSHSISGYMSNDTSSSVSGSVNWYDRGQDEDAFAACGSDSSTGDQYTFSDAESTEDNFVLSIQVPGEFNGVASVYSQSTLTMTGSTSTGPSGSSFSHSESSSYSEYATDYGNVTMGTIVTPFSEYTASSAIYRYSVTGPAVATAYQESVASSTMTGETPLPASFTQTTTAGHGDTAATVIAEYAGSAPTYSAEHLGSTPAELETTDGLAAAMGGMAVHPLLFAGPEVRATVNSAGNAMTLQEAYSSTTPNNWISHPSGIGYRRSVPANGSGSSRSPGIPGNAPITNSGTTVGSDDQELARLVNFDTGGNENPTSTQTAPTSRAEQQAGVATACGMGQSQARDLLGDIMASSSGSEPPWRLGVNPFTGHGYYNPFVGWFGFGVPMTASTSNNHPFTTERSGNVYPRSPGATGGGGGGSPGEGGLDLVPRNRGRRRPTRPPTHRRRRRRRGWGRL